MLLLLLLLVFVLYILCIRVKEAHLIAFPLQAVAKQHEIDIILT